MTPVNSAVVGVEGMTAELSFTVNNAFPLVSNNNIRWLLTRHGETVDITNDTTVDSNILTYEYNTTSQTYTLVISNIQPNYTSEFNLSVANPAGVSTSFIDFIVEGKSH